MSISTIQIQNTNSFKKSNLVIYGLIVVGVILLVFAASNVVKGLIKANSKGAVSASIAYGNGEVYLNEDLLGNLPFEARNLKTGENKITIKNSSREYNTTLNFLPNVQVVVNRDLGISDVFSSGQNFWIEQNESGPTLSIISEPAGASVYIDNTDYGRTPLSNNSLTDGDYDLKIDLPGYEPQTGRIKVEKGYTLNISAKLFPLPVAAKISNLTGSTDLYDVSSDNSILTSDTKSWVKAIIYWNQTRGISLDGTGINKEPVFEFFLDYKGDVYNKTGDIVTDTAEYDKLKTATKGAYLGRKSDSPGLSEAAKQTYTTLKGATSVTTGTTTGTTGTTTPTPTPTPATGTGTTGGTTSSKSATVKPTGVSDPSTGTDMLRVRDAPSLSGKELSKVHTGETYAVLEEQADWAKIKVSDTLQGWVSKAYVTIK